METRNRLGKFISKNGKIILVLLASLMTLPAYAEFPDSRPATGKRVFIFDPKALSWAIYETDGMLASTGHAVGGQAFCPDINRRCRTPVGEYQVYSKEGPYYRSKKFPVPRGGAPMPYAMFFKGGFAIHGSYDVPGFNASHGCIRVYNEDAKWLSSVLPHGSTIIVRPYS